MDSTDDNGGNTKNVRRNKNESLEKNIDIPIQDLSTSESRTPLKTPVKDGEEDLETKCAPVDSGLMNEVNGDAKIDINDVKSCFSGMSKEELLKYANDPFWVRTRMFLFIFFWVIWIAMFIGAIAIIVVAPKCEPPKWYNQGPFYMVNVESFLNLPAEENHGLLKSFTSKLSYLHELNMKVLVLSTIFKTDPLGSNIDVTDFKSIDEKYGSVDDLKTLLKDAETKDIKVMLSFVPNHSSDKHLWFNKSVAREAPYDNYYIWAPSPGTGQDGKPLPPNNWLSVTGGSAWEWNPERNEFYLHQFEVTQPDLNFRSSDLLQEFNDTLSFWLDIGISGFSMDRVQYLLEDTDLQNEGIDPIRTGGVHTDYGFYYHSKTHNHPENAKLLSQWRELIHTKTSEDGILMISGDPPIPADSDETINNIAPVDIVRNNKLLSGLEPNFSVNELYPRLQELLLSNNDWPSIQLGDENKRLGDICNEEDIDGINIIALLMKGLPIIYFGEELGLRNKTYFPLSNSSDSLAEQEKAENSHYKIFKGLLKARESKAVIYGSSNMTVLDDCLIVLTRVKAGNPGYLSAYNLCRGNITVDFTSVEHVPDELMVYLLSLNYGDATIRVKDKVSSSNFFMSPRSAVVFTFVPKIDESN